MFQIEHAGLQLVLTYSRYHGLIFIEINFYDIADLNYVV